MDEFTYQTPQEWFDSLEGEEKANAERIVALLSQFGAADPVAWAASEMSEGIAQTARFLFLHEVRKILGESRLSQIAGESQKLGQPYRIETEGRRIAQELMDSGVEPEKLNAIFQAGASFALNNMLNLLDGTYETAADIENVADAPLWSLQEMREENDDFRLTGRGIECLHESFDSLYETDV